MQNPVANGRQSYLLRLMPSHLSIHTPNHPPQGHLSKSPPSSFGLLQGWIKHTKLLRARSAR